jgi:hypothetical protein
MAQNFFVSVQKLNNFEFCEICGYKKGKKTNFLLFLSYCCWILDPRSGIPGIKKSGSGINILDPQHWLMGNMTIITWMLRWTGLEFSTPSLNGCRCTLSTTGNRLYTTTYGTGTSITWKTYSICSRIALILHLKGQCHKTRSHKQDGFQSTLPSTVPLNLF